MNMNLNLDDEDDEDDDGDDAAGQDDGAGEKQFDVDDVEVVADEANNDAPGVMGTAATAATAAAFNADNNEVLSQDMDGTEDALLMMMQPAAVAAASATSTPMHKSTQSTITATSAAATTGLTSDGNEATRTGVSFVPVARNDRRRTRANNQHKKRKAAKSLALSTLLCEGYNIEQRNCNSFECSGKFRPICSPAHLLHAYLLQIPLHRRH